MSWWEILIIIAACAFVVGVIAASVIRKKQGRSGCDCGGCAGCTGCAACNREKSDGKDSKKPTQQSP